jgi:hypothetical protein
MLTQSQLVNFANAAYAEQGNASGAPPNLASQVGGALPPGTRLRGIPGTLYLTGSPF